MKSTFSNLVYHELGRFPLYMKRKLKIVKYWLKVRSSTNCILNACYAELIENNDEWIVNIKRELSHMGLDYLWDEHYLDTYIIDMIQQRMNDMYKQTILAEISRSSKGFFLYQHLIDNFALQYYLCKSIPSLYKRFISRFRLYLIIWELNMEDIIMNPKLTENVPCVILMMLRMNCLFPVLWTQIKIH